MSTIKNCITLLALGIASLGVALGQSNQAYIVDPAFTGGFNNTVSLFTIQPGSQTWYAAGTFTEYNGQPVRLLVKGNVAGLDASFDSVPRDHVQYTALTCKTNGMLYAHSAKQNPFDPNTLTKGWYRHKASGRIDALYGRRGDPDRFKETILEDGSYASIIYTTSGGPSMPYQGSYLTIMNPQGVRSDTVYIAFKADSFVTLLALRNGNVLYVRYPIATGMTKAVVYPPTMDSLVCGGDQKPTDIRQTVATTIAHTSGYLYSSTTYSIPPITPGGQPRVGYRDFRRYTPDLKLDTAYHSSETGRHFSVLPDLSLIVIRNDSLYRVLANGEGDPNFGPFAAAGVTGMMATDDMEYIYAYGTFQTFAGTPRSRIARLKLSNPVATAHHLSVKSLHVAPNPAKGTVTVSGVVDESVQILTATGQQLLAQPLQATSTKLDIRSLPAGLYLVRCGSQVARLMVE